MKAIQQLTCIILLCCSFIVSAQPGKAFYRLNIVNEQGELLLVKIKNPEVWVTTGLYEEPDKFSFDQFHTMAANYGLTITDIKLHGEFLLSAGKDKPFQMRYFYQATAANDVSEAPDFIAETKWLAADEALSQLSFPHIAFLTKQTLLHPQQVWSAKLQRYTENSKPKFKVLEGFSVQSKNLPTANMGN